MNNVKRLSTEDRNAYRAKIEAMNDADLEAELKSVHTDLALVRESLAEMAMITEPEPASVGPVGFSGAGAVSDFLDVHKAPVMRDERRTVALVMEKNLEDYASACSHMQRNRALRRAHIERARVIVEGAETLRAAAAVIEKQIAACAGTKVQPSFRGFPQSVEDEIKQAKKILGQA